MAVGTLLRRSGVGAPAFKNGLLYAGGYVDCGTITLAGNATPFCFEGKAKRTGNNRTEVVSALINATPHVAPQILFIAGSDVLQANWYDASTAGKLIAGTTALGTGAVFDWAFDFDGTTVRLFVNGAVEASLASSMEATTTRHAYIGGNPGAPINATLDEICLSSVSRHTAAYTPSPGPYVYASNVIGQWHCDEGTGTTTADATGNGHTGTLSGSPTPSWVVSPF